MEIPNSLLIGLLIFGFLVAALLYALGFVPWWGAVIVVFAAPVAAFAAIVFLFYALWIASGSH